jgi:hypothetical protein
MGINAQSESQEGRVVAELGDPFGLTNWILAMAEVHGTLCLRFIDPYDDTLFNSLQIPVLETELLAAAGYVTEVRLRKAKQDYLRQASDWPRSALAEAYSRLDSIEVFHIRKHLDDLGDLVREAAELGKGYFVRFVGD